MVKKYDAHTPRMARGSIVHLHENTRRIVREFTESAGKILYRLL